MAFNLALGLAPVTQLSLAFGSEGTGRREQVKGLQNSRFARSVEACQEIEAGFGTESLLLVDSEIVQSEPLKDHEERLVWRLVECPFWEGYSSRFERFCPPWGTRPVKLPPHGHAVLDEALDMFLLALLDHKEADSAVIPALATRCTPKNFASQIEIGDVGVAKVELDPEVFARLEFNGQGESGTVE